MTQSSPGINLDPAIERKLLGGIVIALVIVAGMAAAAIQNNSRQAESAGWVNHSHAFILEADAILSSLNAAEAIQRTYILSGDLATMQAASDRFTTVAEHLSVAQQLAFKNPTQTQRLDRVASLLQRQIDWNKQSVQLRTSSAAAAAGVFTNALTRANLADIETELDAAKAEENSLLLQREQKLQRHTRRTEQILYTGAGVNVVLLALAFYVVRRDLNLRRRASAALQAANESLEEKVNARTSELAGANEKLQIENLEQKWGQAALQRLVGHHELILNSIRESILVISRNGRIISSNAAAADLAGREARQLSGRSIIDLVTENEISANATWEQHFLSGPMKQGQTLEGQSALLKTPEGRYLPVRVSCYPARDQENLTGAVITISAPEKFA